MRSAGSAPIFMKSPNMMGDSSNFSALTSWEREGVWVWRGRKGEEVSI